MKRFAWLLTLPFAVVVVVFAVHNREPVALDPWPFAPPFNVPLYVVALGAILAGFIAGALVQWAAGAKRRQLARQNSRRLNELQKSASAAKGAANAVVGHGGAGNQNTGVLPPTKLLAAGER